MIVKKLPLGPIGANTYILGDETSKKAILIDCTGDYLEIKKALDNDNLNLVAIFLTHGHFDHVLGVNDIKKIYPDVKVYINKEDEVLCQNIAVQCAHFGINSCDVPKIDEYIDENSKFDISGFDIKAISTPGHSKGSLCYLINGELFSGDTLFYTEIGRCDLFGGSFSEIEKSIRGKLFVLDDKTIVHPGHGQDTSIAYEIKHNAYFGENSRY